MLEGLLFVLIFFLGASIGSFINVLIDRLPEEDGGRSILSTRSRCDHCQQRLCWYNLIPVFSWLALNGRCSSCHNKISNKIFLVELFFGSLGVFSYLILPRLFEQNWLIASELFILCAILVPILLIDWRDWLIPLPLSIALFCNGIIFNSSLEGSFSTWMLLSGFVAGAVTLFFLYAFTFYFRWRGRIEKDETALGWGDVYLIAAIGVNVGMFYTLWVVILACFQAILAYGILKLFGSQKASDDIPDNSLPLGTFLALATFEIMVFLHYPLLQL